MKYEANTPEEYIPQLPEDRKKPFKKLHQRIRLKNMKVLYKKNDNLKETSFSRSL